jgi:hypothetical protein
LTNLKDRLKIITDSMDSITKDKNVSLADRLKSESIKVEALGVLRDAVEASISSADPHSALEKIIIGLSLIKRFKLYSVWILG